MERPRSGNEEENSELQPVWPELDFYSSMTLNYLGSWPSLLLVSKEMCVGHKRAKMCRYEASMMIVVDLERNPGHPYYATPLSCVLCMFKANLRQE